jgi:hypothetical protein
MSNKIKNRILDWKDRQLMSLGKWLIKRALKRGIVKQNTEHEKAEKGFKELGKAMKDMNYHITIDEKILHETKMWVPLERL